MVVSHSNFVPILIEVRLDRGILLNVDARKFSPNAVVRADNPQLRPLVAVAFNVSAAENGSYEFGGSFAFRFVTASGEDFVAPSGGNDERFVATRLNTIVDRDVPLAQRCADGFDFALDGGFDGRKDHPNSLRRRRRRGRRAGGKGWNL